MSPPRLTAPRRHDKREVWRADALAMARLLRAWRDDCRSELDRRLQGPGPQQVGPSRLAGWSQGALVEVEDEARRMLVRVGLEEESG